MELLSLAGDWTLKLRGSQALPAGVDAQKLTDGVPAQIPGDIISALLRAGMIPDPYAGTNEMDIQWIGKTDWALERDFAVPASLFGCKRIFLSIDVLDTIADVYINGRLAGEGDDMFIPRRWDVQNYIRQGKNHLEVVIFSPVRAAAKKAQGLTYPIPESIYPVSSPHRNLVRKAQCMSGWDWGPCLMTGGIYDDIALCGIDGPRIESVQTRLKAVWPGTDTDFDWNAARRADGAHGEPGKAVEELGNIESENIAPGGGEPNEVAEGLRGAESEGIEPGRPDFAVTVTVEADSAEESDVWLEIALAGSRTERRVRLPAGNSIIVEHLTVRQPELWWPSEMGEQKLYDLTIRVGPAEAASVSDAALQAGHCHEVRKHLGFRELTVATREDSIGREMTIVVNGRRIFAKGANWIPADALPSRWTEERLDRLLRDAAAAHMNCLRVWGGGRYESDTFYDLCDRYGIMIWQDCMFSCALYPSDAHFLAVVETEIRAQVKRLSDHPCLALWCGNNEALGAITWYSESRENPERYKKDYELLTYGVLGRVIQELDPDHCWWPSSPSAGPGDFSDNWHSDGAGDMHFWSVWHEAKPFSEYLSVKPRFCSEFGFQSFSSAATIGSFASPAERYFGSVALEAHQRDPKGNGLIGETLSRYFRRPKGFQETLYLSQLQQAMAIKTAVEYWRACKPRCMGTLYWQLNDVWPATSWSSIEYNGLWKLLHYEAKRFYDPLIAALVRDGNTLRFFVVSDLPVGCQISCNVRFCSFDGTTLAETAIHGDLGAEESRQLWSLPEADIPAPSQKCFLEAKLEATPQRPGATTLERSSVLFMTEPKNCLLRRAGLTLNQESAENVEGDVGGVGGDARMPKKLAGSESTEVSYTVSARDAPAFFVQVCDLSGSGNFSDAGFYLAAGESRRLVFKPLNQTAVTGTDEYGGAHNCDWGDGREPECEGKASVPNGPLAVFDLENSCQP